jgi:hypothetical protein
MVGGSRCLSCDQLLISGWRARDHFGQGAGERAANAARLKPNPTIGARQIAEEDGDLIAPRPTRTDRCHARSPGERYRRVAIGGAGATAILAWSRARSASALRSESNADSEISYVLATWPIRPPEVEKAIAFWRCRRGRDACKTYENPWRRVSSRILARAGCRLAAPCRATRATE